MPHRNSTSPQPDRPAAPLLRLALRQKCPRCGEGNLYNPGFTTTVQDQCPVCGLALGRHDSADGPAVLLIFVLGFLIVPMALLLEKLAAPPLYVHALVWGVVALAMTLGALRPLKAFIIALQFKLRPGDWKES